MPVPSLLKVPAVVWGQQRGWVSVPVLRGERWYERWFEWPQDAALILRWVVECNKEANVYWSPLVYANPSRRKQEAHQATSLWAWADLDAVDPRTLDPVPTILWASSPGKYQSLYRLAERVDAQTLEELNRRIAHASKADPSGVDAGQVLRWPGTRNWKYEGGPKGKVLKVTGAVYTVEDLRRYELPKHLQNGYVNPNEMNYQEALERYGSLIPMEAWALIETPEHQVQKGKRSVMLWTLIRTLAEAHLPADAIYTIAKYSPWNKFRGRADEHERLTAEVNKALALHPPQPVEQAEETEEEVEEEAQPQPQPSSLPIPPGWLERYVEVSREYAKGAPDTYHLACGLALLSVACGHYIQCNPTIRPDVHPALWILLIGPSRSGKSRAIKTAMRVLELSEIPVIRLDEFSQEGLIKDLAQAPNNQVVWEAEEVSHILKQAAGRGYMSAVPDMLLKLHDRSTSGRPYERKLSKERIQIRSPHLTVLGATTPQNFLQAFDPDSMDTGFLPRWFQFYDPNPPLPEYERLSYNSDAMLLEVARELADIRTWLVTAQQRQLPLEVQGQLMTVPTFPKLEADLSADAYERWVEWMQENDKKARDNPEIAPVLAEAGQHALKLAMLMAVSRRPEIILGGIQVTLEDVDRAIDIVNSELAKNQELYQMVGTDSWERALQSVWRYIQKHRRVSRTQVHRRFSQQIKSAKIMDEIERTLVDRGLIRVAEVEVIGKNGRRYVRKDYISRVKPSRPDKDTKRKKE